MSQKDYNKSTERTPPKSHQPAIIPRVLSKDSDAKSEIDITNDRGKNDDDADLCSIKNPEKLDFDDNSGKRERKRNMKYENYIASAMLPSVPGSIHRKRLMSFK